MKNCISVTLIENQSAEKKAIFKAMVASHTTITEEVDGVETTRQATADEVTAEHIDALFCQQACNLVRNFQKREAAKAEAAKTSFDDMD